MTFSIVVPTLGRPSLMTLLGSLAACEGPRPEQIVLVDDRRWPVSELIDRPELLGWTGAVVQVHRCGGRGPAAARNLGWRCVGSDWVVFLDDDVRVPSSWLMRLEEDLRRVDAHVVASQGRITVPLVRDRRPTDWERGTAGLVAAQWITADMAYRRAALEQEHGFDERFGRAFREDADLALRVTALGCRIETGNRHSVHPVRPASWWASVAQQRGNADDALMRHLHGRRWHRRVGATVGRRPAHVVTTAAGALAVLAASRGRRRIATAAGMVWVARVASFAWARIAPGPREVNEVARMIATSVAIPPAATWSWCNGLWRHRHAAPWPVSRPPVEAVLVDRDGTIVRDAQYNGSPRQVEPMPGARQALDRLRSAGVPVAVITNQSGIARGTLTMPQVDAVNVRVDELLGPFADWQVCPHGDGEGCECRKPRPGMVHAAARALGVDPTRCVVIGDTGADVAAAVAAGARGVLVPNSATRPDEIVAAPQVFACLGDAVDALLRHPGSPS